ncbi:MAG: cysteine desulfurase NifS, partial [Actinomycetota bacterium]|nr:cysteine desulfurase NifS [Actinomycetota bacterium]
MAPLEKGRLRLFATVHGSGERSRRPRPAAHTRGIVYLDCASAAPWHPAALAAYAEVAASLPGDPSRRHGAGRRARDLLES